MRLTYPTPTDEPEPEVVQSLFERFARAGWTMGASITTLDFTTAVFTALGQERIHELFEIVRPFTDRVTRGSRRPGILAWFKFLVGFRRIGRSLQPPVLSNQEIYALMTIAAIYAKRNE